MKNVRYPLALPCLAVLLVLTISCTMSQNAALPDIRDSQALPEIVREQIKEQCEQNFIQGDIQFVHSIFFKLSTGQSATVIGVTALDGETLRTALLSVEGFVLFEAELTNGQQVQVNRALPPFDNPAFAAGIIRDVQLVFQMPSYKELAIGRLADGTGICRYLQEAGRVTDILLSTDGSKSIQVYTSGYKLARSVSMASRIEENGEMIPGTITLESPGIRGYTLRMTLISADMISRK